MRDLLFKNLTSTDRKRKIIVNSEVSDKEGVRTVIRRHLVCSIREVKDNAETKRPLPYLYVLKEHNDKEQRERFFCRIKGSVYAVSNNRVYLILYMHSLKITLTAVPKTAAY